ncbi:MAG: universal stress protein [Methyloceanibacter sp.]|uniref:universal stress protein n=1 Tax=Methyloceanibacter sp. TaxID=1965321 RepID=UPI003D6D70A2
MAYEAILVNVPLANAKVQIELAARLAKNFGAHLTGICGLTETAMLRSALQNPFIRLEAAKVESLIEQESVEALAAEKVFDAIAGKVGVAHSWLTGEGEAADIIIHALRLQDLAIVEQCRDPSDLLWGPAVQIALSGHPALIVPRAWTSPEFGRRVLIAWNGSAQSAAALRKAMPLLQRAERVAVMIGQSRAAFPSTMRMAPLDVIAYLRHHGVAAEVGATDTPEEGAGEAILKRAAAEGADLIVMGAFGRSRFREWVLGGATRHVLGHMEVPVFMAHQ